MPRAALLAVAVGVGLTGCHQSRFLVDRPVDGILATSPPLGPEENVRVTPLEAGASSSVALVQIRDREQPHVHSRYDLTVYLAAGRGTLWLNGTSRPMRTGDAAYIPRGTPHHFINEGCDPAAAVVVYSPPFSGPDQQPLP